MKIAFGIVSLFEAGGLQRDCLRLAGILRHRGHDVRLFAVRCEDHVRQAHTVTLLTARRTTNHGRDADFGNAFSRAVESDFDITVGFNKLPGLDVLYCADPCVLSGQIPIWKRWLPRHRTRVRLEEACFGPASSTHLLLLTGLAAADYQTGWGTPDSRISILPPAIARHRQRPELRAPLGRTLLRQINDFSDDDVVWLWVAAQPHTKGLDRVLEALVRVPGARLLVVGPDAQSEKSAPYVGMAEQRGIASRVHWLGFREDIAELMALSDLLVHPARLDTTGQVILEAIAMGLPVVASAACGFAAHVRDADCGIVLEEPVQAEQLQQTLERALDPDLRAVWSTKAVAYAQAHDFTGGLDTAAGIIEDLAERRPSRRASPRERSP
jgi:UDP-glucose:(heptosyl)LPS alpha-1,3-glucosyltransferase